MLCLCLHNIPNIFQVQNMRDRGQYFLEVPDKYYDNLKERLKTAKITVAEDIDAVGDVQPFYH